MELNNLFYKKQFGFRKGMSCQDLLLALSKDILNAKQNKQFFLSVFIDLKKAFDTVNFNILFDKLEHYGIPAAWFKSYLTGRKQFVYLNNKMSKLRDVVCGVPQGSILGPLLFLIYINDMPRAVGLDTLLYADDTSFSNANNDLKKLYHDTNNKLKIAEDWFKSNSLTLHPGKTRYILFSPKQEPEELKICDQKVMRVCEKGKEKAFKLVGVWLDERLSWKHHINHIKRKISFNLVRIARNKKCMSNEIKKLLFSALVQSHLSYCTVIWGAALATHIKKLEILQKKAIRLATNAKYNAHCDPLFAQTGMLKLADIHREACIKEAWKAKKVDTNEMGITRSQVNDKSKLPVSRTRSLEQDRLAHIQIVRAWNELSNEMRDKLLLKDHHLVASTFKTHCIFTYKQFSCHKLKCYVCNPP